MNGQDLFASGQQAALFVAVMALMRASQNKEAVESALSEYEHRVITEHPSFRPDAPRAMDSFREGFSGTIQQLVVALADQGG